LKIKEELPFSFRSKILAGLYWLICFTQDFFILYTISDFTSRWNEMKNGSRFSRASLSSGFCSTAPPVAALQYRRQRKPFAWLFPLPPKACGIGGCAGLFEVVILQTGLNFLAI
jgi:hypothetical protein